MESKNLLSFFYALFLNFQIDTFSNFQIIQIIQIIFSNHPEFLLIDSNPF
jgi:hypothetical protein